MSSLKPKTVYHRLLSLLVLSLVCSLALAQGGLMTVKGKVVDIVEDIVVMKFYWGAPFRTRQAVKANTILDECRKPSLFSNY